MIKLEYVSHVWRETVCEIAVQDILSADNIPEYLLSIYQSKGYSNATDPGRLRIIDVNKQWEHFGNLETLSDNVTVLYSDIVAACSAAEYARENGVIYFFHTSERGHLMYPHIHAKYAGEEISIYFNDYHVVGKMKSKTKQAEIVAYVKKHILQLQDEWARIIHH